MCTHARARAHTHTHTHLTLHSRISASRWVPTLPWLSGSLKPFFNTPFVYSYHLFLISSASVRSVSFLSYIVPIFAWNVLLVGISNFLVEISILSHLLFSSVFCIVHLRRLSYLSLLFSGPPHSDGMSFLSPLPFASLLFSTICKAFSDNHFASCISFSLWYEKV